MRQEHGDIGEMRASFAGWDPILEKLVSRLPSALKWKLVYHRELDVWTKVRTRRHI
jgi:salicylate hydroxylase